MIATLAALAPASGRLLSLSPVDLVIILLYFALVLGLGVYLRRYARTGEEFFMAGHQMTAWIAGLAFISANLGSLEMMGYAAATYQYGIIIAHAYWIAAIPAILFLALVMLPFYYICRTHSVPGYLKLRYGEGARSLSAISFAIMTILMSGINMFSMAIVMKVILGWNIHLSIWVSSLTVALYVMAGGLLSAIFNEVLQFFLIRIGTLVIPVVGLIETGGWTGLVQRIQQNFPGQDFTHCGARPERSPTTRWACIGRESCWVGDSRSPSDTGRPISWSSSASWRRAIYAPQSWARSSEPRAR